MGHNLATWKALEDMMIELKKKGVAVPEKILEDLRSAQSMIKLSCIQGSGDAVMKAEELMANVEAYVVTEGQKVFNEKHVNGWLQRLEEAGACGEICGEAVVENKFVTGVPRDQKWVRVESIDKLPAEKILELAKEQNLQVNPQKDGRLVVFGPPQTLKEFIKKMTAETNKKDA